MASGSTRRAGGGFRLFSVAGIPIHVDLSWFIIFFLVAGTVTGWFRAQMADSPALVIWLLSGTAALMLFVSVVVHELSHSLVARAKGIPVARITLFMFGGVSQLDREPDRPLDEFQIAIVGPLTSFVLGGLFTAAFAITLPLDSAGLSALLGYLAFINIALGVFNLVPAFPLDGGRVLRAALWSARNSFHAATVAAAAVGKVLAYTLMALGLSLAVLAGQMGGLWWVLIGFFLRQAAAASAQRARVGQALADEPVSRIMTHPVLALAPEDSLEQAVNRLFLARPFQEYAVAVDGRLIGMLAVADVARVPAAARRVHTVGECMTPVAEIDTAEAQAPMTSVLERLLRSGRQRMPVVDHGRLTGMVSRDDILGFLRVRTDLACR
ncbi:MAG: site-2 protease family protein [Acidobacteriota bacterium]